MQPQFGEVSQLAKARFARDQRRRSTQHSGVEHFGLHGADRVLCRADLQNVDVAFRI